MKALLSIPIGKKFIVFNGKILKVIFIIFIILSNNRNFMISKFSNTFFLQFKKGIFKFLLSVMMTSGGG